MDLTSLVRRRTSTMFVGNFAAMAELANRRSPDNTMKSMTPIERENLKEAIRRQFSNRSTR